MPPTHALESVSQKQSANLDPEAAKSSISVPDSEIRANNRWEPLTLWQRLFIYGSLGVAFGLYALLVWYFGWKA